MPVNGAAPPVVGAPIAVPDGPPPPVVPAANRQPDSYGQLQDELNRRGVLWQKLEGPDDKNVWTFSCGVPKRNDPGQTHYVEASTVGDSGLAAVRAAIDKIDHDAP